MKQQQSFTKKEVFQTARRMLERYGGKQRAKQAAVENKENMKEYPERQKFWHNVSKAI